MHAVSHDHVLHVDIEREREVAYMYVYTLISTQKMRYGINIFSNKKSGIKGCSITSEAAANKSERGAASTANPSSDTIKVGAKKYRPKTSNTLNGIMPTLRLRNQRNGGLGKR